ncbi:hypothetical protein GCM10022406_35970 [Hymenobacter algoricola]|uniref:S9 family peptidase n=1 Tax=Hymenobacter algoricola TaxID=486267 RepID=A0ABP7NP99_9BACT
MLGAGALTGTGRAQAQPSVQTQFVAKAGWLYGSAPAPAIGLDSVAAAGRQNSPTQYVVLHGYRVALRASGEVIVFRPAQATQNQHAYPGQDGGWPVQPLAYAQGRLLFLATSDGYLKPRKLRLVELDLAKNSCQQLSEARHIEAVRYSEDRMVVYYTKNGAATQWKRPPE